MDTVEKWSLDVFRRLTERWVASGMYPRNRHRDSMDVVIKIIAVSGGLNFFYETCESPFFGCLVDHFGWFNTANILFFANATAEYVCSEGTTVQLTNQTWMEFLDMLEISAQESRYQPFRYEIRTMTKCYGLYEAFRETLDCFFPLDRQKKTRFAKRWNLDEFDIKASFWLESNSNLDYMKIQGLFLIISLFSYCGGIDLFNRNHTHPIYASMDAYFGVFLTLLILYMVRRFSVTKALDSRERVWTYDSWELVQDHLEDSLKSVSTYEPFPVEIRRFVSNNKCKGGDFSSSLDFFFPVKK